MSSFDHLRTVDSEKCPSCFHPYLQGCIFELERKVNNIPAAKEESTQEEDGALCMDMYCKCSYQGKKGPPPPQPPPHVGTSDYGDGSS